MGGISFPIHEARMAEKDARIARLKAALERIAIGAKPAPLIAREALAKEEGKK